MTKQQVKAICDFFHDVIMALKKLLGIKPREVSLLCYSLGYLNGATWLERAISNGTIEDYIVRD